MLARKQDETPFKLKISSSTKCRRWNKKWIVIGNMKLNRWQPVSAFDVADARGADSIRKNNFSASEANEIILTTTSGEPTINHTIIADSNSADGPASPAEAAAVDPPTLTASAMDVDGDVRDNRREVPKGADENDDGTSEISLRRDNTEAANDSQVYDSSADEN